MLLRNVDASHLLYGSDTPYTDIAASGKSRSTGKYGKLTAAQKQMLFSDNAKALLPKLR